MNANVIEPALDQWQETVGGRATLVNHSENHTFRIDTPDGASHMLRVHRPGYQSQASVESELAWLTELRRRGLPVPRPLPARSGQLVARVGDDRMAVLFALEPGREATPEDDLPWLFRSLGGLAAAAHVQVQDWALPRGFERPSWTDSRILDPDGAWGDWRRSPGVTGGVRSTLEQVDLELRRVLTDYGTAADRFGLIHADMRLANVLIDGQRVTLLDFDDSGFGWFMYDFAASLSFVETSPLAPRLRQEWLEGYVAIRPLSQRDVDALDAMVLLRRLALLAWIGSHSETALAAGHRAAFAADTARMASHWLSA